MKTRKSIHRVYQEAPLDRWTLNGTRRQDDARKSPEEQDADRLKLRTHGLISEVHRLLQRVDADRGSYFDTNAQRELMKSIAWHVNDAAMLALIEAWLGIQSKRPAKELQRMERDLV